MKTPSFLPFFVIAFALALPNTNQAAPDEEKKPKPEKQRKKEGAKRKRDRKPPEERPAPKAEKPKPVAEKKETRPFLGVSTSPVAPSVKEYLELDEGFGIQLQQILPDSPAAAAGLKKHDVLVKFEDQLLISPEHLSLLVQRKNSGDEVALTIVRKGAEKVISVALGEKEESFFSPRIEGRMMHGRPPHFTYLNVREWKDAERKRDDLYRRRDWFYDRGSAPGEKTAMPESRSPQGKPPAVSVSPGFPVSVFGTEGVLKIDNEEGEVTITEKDGKHQIEIQDAKGHLIHKGEFDPESGVESLPKAARDHLETMKLDNLEVLTPQPAEPEKASAPPAEKKKPAPVGEEIL